MAHRTYDGILNAIRSHPAATQNEAGYSGLLELNIPGLLRLLSKHPRFSQYLLHRNLRKACLLNLLTAIVAGAMLSC